MKYSPYVFSTKKEYKYNWEMIFWSYFSGLWFGIYIFLLNSILNIGNSINCASIL